MHLKISSAILVVLWLEVLHTTHKQVQAWKPRVIMMPTLLSLVAPWGCHRDNLQCLQWGKNKLRVIMMRTNRLSHHDTTYIVICGTTGCRQDKLSPNIKMPPYQYKKSHCGDKTILRSSYLHNGISYTGKMTSVYWIRALQGHQDNSQHDANSWYSVGTPSKPQLLVPVISTPLLASRQHNQHDANSWYSAGTPSKPQLLVPVISTPLLASRQHNQHDANSWYSAGTPSKPQLLVPVISTPLLASPPNPFSNFLWGLTVRN